MIIDLIQVKNSLGWIGDQSFFHLLRKGIDIHDLLPIVTDLDEPALHLIPRDEGVAVK